MRAPENRTEAIRMALRQLWEEKRKHPTGIGEYQKASAADVRERIQEQQWDHVIDSIFPEKDDEFDVKTWNALVSAQRKKVEASLADKSRESARKSGALNGAGPGRLRLIECVREYFESVESAMRFAGDERLRDVECLATLRDELDRYLTVVRLADGDEAIADKMIEFFQS